MCIYNLPYQYFRCHYCYYLHGYQRSIVSILLMIVCIVVIVTIAFNITIFINITSIVYM